MPFLADDADDHNHAMTKRRERRSRDEECGKAAES